MASGKKLPPKPKEQRSAAGGNDDDTLWESVARSVTPLARRNPVVPPGSASQPPTVRKNADSLSDPLSDKGETAPPPRVDLSNLRIGGGGGDGAPGPARPAARGLGHGDAPGVDRRTAERFRRGLMPIEATLDLHGHSQDSGRQALFAFLRAHQAAGRRCVLVITGKGLKDDWSVGVLRQALPEWLNSPECRKLVLAFSYAQPHHGGSGAVYILLRRNRG